MMNADEYAYLTFETANGKKISVSISSLTLTISGNTLVAGSESFMLSSLTKMYFSQSDEGTLPDPIANGLAFEVAEVTGKMSESFASPALTNPYQLSVSWSSSNEGVATVDDTGQVSLVAAGATVITASFAGNDEYLAGSVSYTLTVEEDTGTGISLIERNRGRVSVYTLNGIHVCSSDSLSAAQRVLRRGTYIIMRDGIRFKISIK